MSDTDHRAQWRAIVQREAKAAGNAIIGLLRARQKFPELASLAEPRIEHPEPPSEPPIDQLQRCDELGI